MLKFRLSPCSLIACLVLPLLAGCARPQPELYVELFLVNLAEGEEVAYGRRLARIARADVDPDVVASNLLGPGCDPAILHSTSWRWEKNGSLILTYIAFAEAQEWRGAEPSRLSWHELIPPLATNPKKPRPAQIQEKDVLSHAIRHITFLVRRSADRRIAESLSPQSMRFFQAMCAQLAGRLETSLEFEDCAGSSGPP